MSSTPKFFTEAMTGAPQLGGVVGSLIAVLDACLVNGFGLKTADSVTVAGGIATMNFSTGHSFQPHSIALLAGATPAGLNGEQRILTTSTNTATFATSAPDGTASGTITAKVAPLGWTKLYSGTNKAAYKPSALEASSAVLRVDDTGVLGGANMARVRMYESMTDVDTGVNPAPTDSKVSGGLHWWKTWSPGAEVSRWTLVGDDRNFYFAPVVYSSVSPTATASAIWTFGDHIPYRSGDAYAGMLLGETGSVSNNPIANLGQGNEGHTLQLMRSHTAIGGSVSGARRAFTGEGSSGTDTRMGPFPSPASNSLFLSKIYVGQNPLSTYGPRGIVPGALYVPQTNTNNGQFPRGAVVDGTGEFTGKKIYAVPQTSSSLSTIGDDFAFFFDLTGPWRD